MGSDAFHVCYGVRREVYAADGATMEALELRRHPWQVAAERHGLQTWWGTTTDEQRFFVLVGRVVGHYGWQGEAAGRFTDAEAAAVAAGAAERLRAAGIEGVPAWHFQFEPGAAADSPKGEATAELGRSAAGGFRRWKRPGGSTGVRCRTG